ncbi:VOC family protein [Actinoplanes sp. NPDC049316]|uniref:VOC family protein n=1 Tax=Actinoplanes sp. NPDC049316 TaxID=3154727 RepID=UPI00343C4E25
MAKERPVAAGGRTADPRGRESAPPRPHPARTSPAPVAPVPRRPASATDPRPIASPFLTDPAQPAEAADQAQMPATEPAADEPAAATAAAATAAAATAAAATAAAATAADETAGDQPEVAHQRSAAEAAQDDGDQRDAPSRGVAKVPAPWPGLQLQPMVHVADMPAAVAFYEKFGGDLVHGDRDGDWVLMQVGTAQIGLVTRPPDPARGESTVELNFSATMPLDRLERLLRDRDVRIVRMAVDRDLGTRLHVETPDGMPIKIHQVEPDLLI